MSFPRDIERRDRLNAWLLDVEESSRRHSSEESSNEEGVVGIKGMTHNWKAFWRTTQSALDSAGKRRRRQLVEVSPSPSASPEAQTPVVGTMSV